MYLKDFEKVSVLIYVIILTNSTHLNKRNKMRKQITRSRARQHPQPEKTVDILQYHSVV